MTEGARGGHDDQDTITGSVTLVGTAHVSQSSVDEVESTIEAECPDIVAVELDEGRYRQLAGETPEDLDAADLLHGNTVFQFLAYWLLSYVQTQLGERFDVTPGADMMAASAPMSRSSIGISRSRSSGSGLASRSPRRSGCLGR
jgi:pheromone shutdown protein TraB